MWLKQLRRTLPHRRVFCCYALVCVVLLYAICAIFGIFGTVSKSDQYDFKRRAANQRIHSSGNSRQCVIPDLPLHAPEMMRLMREPRPINCSLAGYDWVQCELGVCRIKAAARQEHGQITCDYEEILRKDDYSVRYRESVRTDGDYVLQVSDFVHVKCWKDNTWLGWSGILFGLHQRPQISPQSITRSPDRRDMNIVMLGFDSLSRNAFMRKLPKSYAFLTDVLHADVLRGYNIVGDGTPQALIPLLTGYTELDLPETRRRMPDSHSVDVFPFIWRRFRDTGYVTSFNEDVPNVGTFTYRLNGFERQPTHHYMRTYYLALENELHKYPRLCVGQHPRHQVMLNYTRQFMTTYKDRAHFVFSFHGELSHDSINLVGVADGDLLQWLRELHESGRLENTLLMVMSDHGNRFAEVRNTYQGKMEERLPFFSFVFPEWFKRKHEMAYRQFRNNTGRLVTPFDVHATLEDILDMQAGDNYKTPPRDHALSLFSRFPETRSCADAHIEPHWCVCHAWRELTDLHSEQVMKLARSVVDAINRHTADRADLCSRLYLHAVSNASVISASDNLLRFRRTKDADGFQPDLSAAAMAVPSELYQVKLSVRPGDGIFEATVQLDTESGKFHVDLGQVSRVNKYGEQARCIMEVNPELRKYCRCKEHGDE